MDRRIVNDAESGVVANLELHPVVGAHCQLGASELVDVRQVGHYVVAEVGQGRVGGRWHVIEPVGVACWEQYLKHRDKRMVKHDYCKARNDYFTK